MDTIDKNNRSFELIANFVNGHAENWYFALPDAFKEQLDIKLTKRIIEKKETMCWTQGKIYCFNEGHIFYDTPKGYLVWSDALKHIKTACFVIKGTPVTLKDKIFYTEGSVHFKLSKPNYEKTKLETVSTHHTTQTEFVTFLKTGILP